MTILILLIIIIIIVAVVVVVAAAAVFRDYLISGPQNNNNNNNNNNRNNNVEHTHYDASLYVICLCSPVMYFRTWRASKRLERRNRNIAAQSRTMCVAKCTLVVPAFVQLTLRKNADVTCLMSRR